MYRHCIFCSTNLGANDVLEPFRVGSRLAFDTHRGRLWVVCRRCARWNLAPLEERWEAVEDADRLFRAARVRVQSENIGLARLGEGTHLIRVGDAVPLELAAWRYGDRTVRRQRRTWLGAGATTIGGAALIIGGAPLLAAASVPMVAVGFGVQIVANAMVIRGAMRVVHRIPAESSPIGEELVIRQSASAWSRLVPSDREPGFGVEVPLPLPPTREESGGVVRWLPPPPVRIEGEEAERMLERLLVSANAAGLGHAQRAAGGGASDRGGRSAGTGARACHAGGGDVPGLAVAELEHRVDPGLPRAGSSGSSGRFGASASRAARSPRRGACFRAPMCSPWRWRCMRRRNERALEGELKLLEAAWREAEEIASIADTLPDDPLERIRR
jgi:hypothetical protein